jgi:hypothetical protein
MLNQFTSNRTAVTHQSKNIKSNTYRESLQYKTACGGRLLVPQKAKEHLLAHPDAAQFFPDAASRMVLPTEGFAAVEIEMGHLIGREGVVKMPMCGLSTQILFAQRNGRERASRVAPMGLKGEEVSTMVILAYPSRTEKNSYVLISTWIGKLAQKEPWDKNIASETELHECIQYWCSHALEYDPTVMGVPFESTWEKVAAMDMAVH